ncbi:hypothetical protein [Streptomyces sp. NPDC049879]|uniref:hypothetical protein n=1 Tax=Streptomyces sp. NPDC049879 TaxID=3365598 RepID=UPI0037A5B8BD
MADVRFDLTRPSTSIFGRGVVLDQVRVHQQHTFDDTAGLIYASQVIGNGVVLADETEAPPTGTRDSRGDLAINRVTLDGTVTGVMYARAFDHGSGLGVENEAGTPYLWMAYDAEMQPIGTNGHGRKLVRVPFQDGAILDVGDPGLDVYDPIPDASSITPGLDRANGRMAIAFNRGSGTRYQIHDLAKFKARDFSDPLYEFARPSYPDFQAWQLYGNFIYQFHGTAYDDNNPGPPDGQGNVYWTVIDIRTGRVVQRLFFAQQPTMEYREPESVAIWETPTGPQFVYGWASSAPPRQMALYAIRATVTTTVTIDAVVVTTPEPGIEVTAGVDDPGTVQTWTVERVVAGVTQTLASGVGAPPASQDFFDSAPPGCVPIVYRYVIQRTTGEAESAATPQITYAPPGGCGSAGVVGEQPNTLGCAENYTAVIHWRGGALPYPASSMDRLTKVSWGRTANDVSDGVVTVLKGDLDPECCAALGDAEPWIHELTIYRDGELVWQGIILRTTARTDSITIEAVDVSAWFEHVVNTYRVTYTATAADPQGRKRASVAYIAWNHIRLNLVESSLSVPPDWCQIMPYMIRRESKRTITMEKDGSSNTAVWSVLLSDFLKELVKRGLAYTTVGRSVILRERPTADDRAQARLTATHFSGEVEVVKDGTSAATYAFATTQDAQDVTKGKTIGYGRTGTPYGRLDVLVDIAQDEDKITDAELRDAAKTALAGRYPVPLTISLPTGSALTPDAPVTIRQLVPLERFDVLADSFCTPVQGGFILSDLAVTWEDGEGGEKVAVSFIPIGDVDEELGG